MKKKYVLVTAALFLLAFTGCREKTSSTAGSEPVAEAPAETSGETAATAARQGRKLTEGEIKETPQYTKLNFESKIITDTVTNERTEQEMGVYLPPSYEASGKSYPVVYYLHGFGENFGTFLRGQKKYLDELFDGGAKEFIIVGISGATKSGGSFYVNSPITGNWEDYIIEEAIPIIDANFRTIDNSSSRGICGFSMGGFGALNLSLKHPDVFSSFIAMSPGLIEDGDMRSALLSWAPDSGFKKAYAQAFSPNEQEEKIYGNIPELDVTPEEDQVYKDWENGYGNIRQKIEDYLSLDTPLKAMKIIYGEQDGYSWIPRGCDFMSEVLNEHGIEHSLDKLPGGHSIPTDVTETYLVPFFNENLEYE